ncbi:MAG: hypothetical protein ACYTFG_17620 [Planctomycetota bacterium]
MGYTTQLVDDIVQESFQDLESDLTLATEEQGEKRKHPRKPSDFQVRFRILVDNGRVFNRGAARVIDIGPGGALLTDFSCARDAFPTRPFKIAFKVISGEFDGIEAECEPVRFSFSPTFGIGVRFETISVRV